LVETAVVFIEPLEDPIGPETLSFDVVEYITRQLFNQRRKMLSNAVRKILPSEFQVPIEELLALLEAANINPNDRAQQLSVEKICRFSFLFQMKYGDSRNLNYFLQRKNPQNENEED